MSVQSTAVCPGQHRQSLTCAHVSSGVGDLKDKRAKDGSSHGAGEGLGGTFQITYEVAFQHLTLFYCDFSSH